MVVQNILTSQIDKFEGTDLHLRRWNCGKLKNVTNLVIGNIFGILVSRERDHGIRHQEDIFCLRLRGILFRQAGLHQNRFLVRVVGIVFKSLIRMSLSLVLVCFSLVVYYNNYYYHRGNEKAYVSLNDKMLDQQL